MTTKRNGRSRTKLDKAAGDAATLLNGQLAAFSAAAQDSLQRWVETHDDPDAEYPDYYLESAVKLSDAAAAIAGAIARMKAESRHTIHVERAQKARATATLAPQPPDIMVLDSQDESSHSPRRQGGEGER